MYTVCVAASGLLCGAIRYVTPQNSKKAMDLLCSAFLAVILISPLGGAVSEVSEEFAQFGRVLEKAELQDENFYDDIITEYSVRAIEKRVSAVVFGISGHEPSYIFVELEKEDTARIRQIKIVLNGDALSTGIRGAVSDDLGINESCVIVENSGD